MIKTDRICRECLAIFINHKQLREHQKLFNHQLSRKQIINTDEIKIFEAFGLFYAKPLYIGKYEDCCHYNYEFKTKIPKWLNLPPLAPEYGDNLAEGIVIKPMKNVYIKGKGGKMKRPIVKHKHQLFNEKISTMDKQFGKFDDRNGTVLKGKDMINTQCLLNMINTNRYQSVISKLN